MMLEKQKLVLNLVINFFYHQKNLKKEDYKERI